MAEHNLDSMIVLSATNYAIWKPRMEDILFCKDLHDPLENKGEKPEAKKDEEWRKMNRKTIGLIRQCIGHEVFHHVAQETSAYDLWIKLEEMYQAKTSRNKALLMRRLVNLKFQRKTTVAEHTSEFQSLVNQLTSVDLEFDDEMQALLLLSSLLESWETLVVSLSNSAPNGKLTTSMVMDALFNEEARRREMGSTDQSESQALVLEGSRERGRGQGRGHHRDTAATAVMAVDEDEFDVLLAASDDGKLDWVLDSGSAYHLCRDREMQRDAGLTLVEEFSEFPRKIRRCCGERRLEWLYRLDGNVQTGRATVQHGSSGISKENGQGKQPLHRGTQSKRREEGDQIDFKKLYSEGRGDAEASLFCSRFDQWRCSLQLCAHGRIDGATTTHKVTYFAAHPGGGCGAPRWEGAGTSVWRCIHFGGKWNSPLMRLGISDAVLQSYGGAGSEVVRKDNLKTSDYPPVGWRGRLLSPAHLDESKPTWMSPSPVAKPKPDWSSCGSVHVTVKLLSYLELLESLYLFVFLDRLG
ncbi:hypothetical protein Acr_07g0011270 [Actinidia rufa]|uniref:Retrovirus-related Pol polyprotein from transposon TNT 1-94 n=1 Tax=Actinidia rufa TaxID=165716 RepID=A0A7J0EWS3_9ERIC|nr:hypothetical protein Acr_07g0011270 [Actinidia rufa]